MRKLAFAGIVLQPSVASSITVVASTVMVFINTIVNIGGSSDQLFRIILGSNTSPELIDTTKSMVSGLAEIIFDNPTVNKLLFFAFWILVGLVVYVFVNGAGSGLNAAQKFYDEEKMIHVHKDKLEQEVLLKLTLIAAAICAWVLYMVVFLKLFLPFSVLSFQVAWGGDLKVSTVLTGLFGFVVLLVTLHLHIVLLRCATLRPRIIGGWDDILAAELD
jgi:hypothetical protein